MHEIVKLAYIGTSICKRNIILIHVQILPVLLCE